MPKFEIFNQDGSLRINLASRLTKMLGTIDTTLGASGSIQNDYLKMGTAWYTLSCSFQPAPGRGQVPSGVTINKTTGVLSWFPQGAVSNPNFLRITYGVYSNGQN